MVPGIEPGFPAIYGMHLVRLLSYFSDPRITAFVLEFFFFLSIIVYHAICEVSCNLSQQICYIYSVNRHFC